MKNNKTKTVKIRAWARITKGQNIYDIFFDKLAADCHLLSINSKTLGLKVIPVQIIYKVKK